METSEMSGYLAGTVDHLGLESWGNMESKSALQGAYNVRLDL